MIRQMIAIAMMVFFNFQSPFYEYGFSVFIRFLEPVFIDGNAGVASGFFATQGKFSQE